MESYFLTYKAVHSTINLSHLRLKRLLTYSYSKS